MKLIEITEKYQQIKISNLECKELQEEKIYSLQEEIRESFKSLEVEQVSEKFSELFQIWSISGDLDLTTNNLEYEKNKLENKYRDYADHFSLLPPNRREPMGIAASRGVELLNLSAFESRETELSKLLDFADDKTVKNVIASKEIIEYMLEILWDCLFQSNLASIDDAEAYLKKKQEVDCNELIITYHKDWALYELINQMKRYITTLIKEGNVKRKKFSSLKKDEQEGMIVESSKMCEFILSKYINDDTSTSTDIKSWLPSIERDPKLILSNIIINSNLVGYMLEYKLKSTQQKNKLKNEAFDLVTHLYKNLIRDDVIYDAMLNYAKEMEEDYIVTYKNRAFCPKIVFNFLLSIIQEVIRRTLTKRKENIFYQLIGSHRDYGLSEKNILNKVQKDAKIYFLMYAYFDKPIKKTFDKKRDKLESWLESLNTLRFGVLDEYLFDLSKATQISYKAKTVTEIVTIKPKI